MASASTLPHVLIIGGGFGGLNAAKALTGKAVRVTLIDRTNHHLFQPLLYQVATGGLSSADIASPLRTILRRQRNVAVLLAAATAIDLAARTVILADGGTLTYEYLILAAGADNTYFGHGEWEPLAPGLKSLDDAVELRRRIYTAFEAAERTDNPAARRRHLTFVVVGGGATGVEMAGAIAEVARETLPVEYRAINAAQARILLVDNGPRLLVAFPARLSARAKRDLQSLGVEVRLNSRVTQLEPGAVVIGDERIEAATVIWAAGVAPSPLTRSLGVPLDRAGHVLVEPDLSLPGHPEAFAIGDLATLPGPNGAPLPGVAPVAMQGGTLAARNVLHRLAGEPTAQFHYRDKGILATIGRNRAVADIFGVRLTGFPAWFAWALVHVALLIGYRNRTAVMAEWIWAYFTRQRRARLVSTSPRPPERVASRDA